MSDDLTPAEHAAAIEETRQQLIDFAGQCTESQWMTAPIEGDPRSVGVITDGNLRDTDKIAGLGFPAFSLSRRPIDYRMRMRVYGVGEPVTIGGVTIASGDLLIADDDGVVVVPRVSEAEVLRRARERAAGESTVLSELLAGETLRQVWDRHGIL